MPSRDPYLARISGGQKQLGCTAAIEVSPSGKRIRLRATLPTPEGVWKQRRISTDLGYPWGIEQARKLAEQLSKDAELHRIGLEPFPFDRWFEGASMSGDDEDQAVSGLEAVRLTEQWWSQQRRRGESAAVSWATDYASPLKPLLPLPRVERNMLKAPVESKAVGSRSRRRASIAAVAVARALGMGPEAVASLKELSKGYSPQKDAAPRDLPTDQVIVRVIDALPADWQWVAGICATYGTRPHEALMSADVLANGLIAIGRTVGAQLGVALRRFGAPFEAYDLRHAWAVRAIHHPQISPSLAAKSLGHSLLVHTSLYQRWFDSASMASLVAQM